MTEKRFTKNIQCFVIPCFYDTGKQISVKEVVDLLNEQHETIEQLKKEILWWKYRCGEDISGDV